MPVRRSDPLDTRQLLDEAYARFARPDFITDDPVQVPRSFTDVRDAELIGLLTATIAWGQRRTILTNAWRLVRMMDGEPHAFIMGASETEVRAMDRFVHRTFQGVDLCYFVAALRHLVNTHGGLEAAFLTGTEGHWDAAQGIHLFRERFFQLPHPERTRKHVADPAKGSNAKRLNMFLRWMVRPDDRGVDMGHWRRIRPADLMVPLDVHTGRVARDLGLLQRRQDDWKSVIELTEQLRKLDPVDPVRYDIALFALGVAASAPTA